VIDVSRYVDVTLPGITSLTSSTLLQLVVGHGRRPTWINLAKIAEGTLLNVLHRAADKSFTDRRKFARVT